MTVLLTDLTLTNSGWTQQTRESDPRLPEQNDAAWQASYLVGSYQYNWSPGSTAAATEWA